MNFKKSVLRSAVISAVGVAGVAAFMPSTASAVAITDGLYAAIINVTPTPGGVPSYGTDGAWSSSFSFGLSSPGSSSQKMTDNSKSISTPSGTRGSSALGNGAGSFLINLSGGSFTASGFQVDAISGTAGGTFVQYGSITGGTVTGTGGMALNVTGRMGAVSGSFPCPVTPAAGCLRDLAWNIDDFTVPSTTLYRPFTTGASANLDTAANGAGFINAGAITGAEAVSIGDINGDGRTDYNIILVSAAHVGSQWGGFFGAGYLETWNVNLVSVPIPAAAWLFGSGLMGLAAVARRKKKITA